MIGSLRLECIKIGTSAQTKEQLIEEIGRLAKQSSVLSNIDRELIEKRLIEREKIVSTGLTNGIAIPHCTFDKLDSFVVGLIIIPEGIDYKSFDKKKSNLVFFIIGNKKDRNKHIKILSSISKLSKDTELFNKIKNTKEPLEAFNVLQSGIDIPVEVNGKINKCQFVIHVQDEDLFFDVLEILSSGADGSISVLETMNAGYYLNKLPLFSTFWNDTDKVFSRVIIAVVDSKLMNDTIRRINMVKEKNAKGILVTVNNVLYSDGSIDF